MVLNLLWMIILSPNLVPLWWTLARDSLENGLWLTMPAMELEEVVKTKKILKKAV